MLPCLDRGKPEIAPGSSPFRLEVRTSDIHRWGVYTCEAIAARRFVIRYTGELISDEEGQRRKIRPYSYLFSLPAGGFIDGAIGGNGAQIINHCCNPNLLVRRTRQRVYYFAGRDIAAGEELTIDYRFPANSTPTPCRCGSPNCRGTINVRLED